MWLQERGNEEDFEVEVEDTFDSPVDVEDVDDTQSDVCSEDLVFLDNYPLYFSC